MIADRLALQPERVTGELVHGDDPTDPAGVIAAALANDSLYAKCVEQTTSTAARFSWDRAARETIDAITNAGGQHIR